MYEKEIKNMNNKIKDYEGKKKTLNQGQPKGGADRAEKLKKLELEWEAEKEKLIAQRDLVKG